MKRILIITQTTNTNSGWGRYSSEIIGRLRKVMLVSSLEEGDNSSSLKRKDSLGSFLRNISLARKMAQNIDIVHVLDGWPYAIYGYFAVMGTNKKLFINAVGTYSIVSRNIISPKSILMKLAYARASKVFAISHYTENRLKKNIPWVDSTIVYLGVNLLPRLTSRDGKSVEDKIGGRSPVILTVGALKKRKGQIHTLQAIFELKKDYPNILYAMVGDGGDEYYRKGITSFAEENGLIKNVLMAGLVTDEELSAWYEKSDVFALNSINHGGHFEGWGMVLLEAASFGKPVVGSRDCGIEDALRDGFNGFLTNQSNHKDIALKIKKSLNNKRKLGSNSIEFVRSFSWDKTIGTYLAFYKSGER